MPRPAKDLTGQRFGRWVVKERQGSNKDGRAQWLCECDCGNEGVISAGCLVSDQKGSRSCGCLLKEARVEQGKRTRLPNSLGAKRRVFRNYVWGAKLRGLIFALTEDQVFKLLDLPCEYCGESDSIKSISTGEYAHNGIDRIDSTKGYTLDNCVPCCDKCNRAKRDWPVEAFKEWITKVYNHLQIEKANERYFGNG